MTVSAEVKEGLLYLEDGSVFRGRGFGFRGTAVGELVFNTSMTGYQELLTDPSCKGQIINMTYPIIGNYGVSGGDSESDQIQAFGIVIRDLCDEPSNSRCEKTLNQWMEEQKIPGICGVDTRQITKKIRRGGTVKALISTEGISISRARQLCEEGVLKYDYMKTAGTAGKQVLEPAAAADAKPGPDLDAAGTGQQPSAAGQRDSAGGRPRQPLQVAVLDFGTRKSVLRCLTDRNCRLTVFPYGTPAEEILAEKPDGVFLTGGPGDPAQATEAVEEVRKIIREVDIPMFGVGLGHQILSIALGGTTYRMKYGHRGTNHGVYDKNTKRSYITAHNHGYAVQYESIILKGMEITHLNLNDGTVEGMEHRDVPIFSVQFIPGANENAYLYDRFVDEMIKSREEGGEE